MPRLDINLLTLEDFWRSNRLIDCHCRTCRHSNHINAKTIIHKTGPHLRVAWVAKYLRCSRCGSKDVEVEAGEVQRHPNRYPSNR